MTTAYLGLGSNLGRRSRNLSAARRRLRQKGARILRQSRVIETEPWGVADQPRFLNQVVEVEWSATPRQLLKAAKGVEKEGGRRPARRWGPRLIDVDILLFGDLRISQRGLVIPHPRIGQRGFVRQSLAELGVKYPTKSADPRSGSP
ncbi:MAG: 2-amino-4-hydroxy-6-hydroxymethyldihydropteridine diphosphokinase [Candidatus Dormibacteraeota bacterium]|nr:2-amino-4-hydroxy-6-hydroxymethyldihydropteridine diphosphokinase [Candidatus Dormibacteraeota bacterium]